MVRPSLSLFAAVLVAVEGLVVLVGGVWLAVEIYVTSEAVGLAAGVGVLALAIGGALLAGSVGVLRGQVWARGPVVTWQLFTAFIAMLIARNGLWILGVPVLVLAIAIGVLLAGPWVIQRRDALSD